MPTVAFINTPDVSIPVPAEIIDGNAIAAAVRADVAAQVKRLQDDGVEPGLAAVLVGDDPASHVYVRMKRRDCEEVGIADHSEHLPADTTQDELHAVIDRLNADAGVHGIIVQLPLPGHLDADAAIERVDPTKDADGFHPTNLGRLLMGRPGPVPATPKGIVRLLDEAGVETEGAHAVVVGRSTIVGKPLALLLLLKGTDATVNVAHSRTRDVGALTRDADILVAAVGRPGLITADMVRPGAAVIDVGISRIDDPSTDRGYRLVGDVAYDEVAEVAGHITPVPGGVGPMTRAMLLENVIEAVSRSA